MVEHLNLPGPWSSDLLLLPPIDLTQLKALDCSSMQVSLWRTDFDVCVWINKKRIFSA